MGEFIRLLILLLVMPTTTPSLHAVGRRSLHVRGASFLLGGGPYWARHDVIGRVLDEGGAEEAARRRGLTIPLLHLGLRGGMMAASAGSVTAVAEELASAGFASGGGGGDAEEAGLERLRAAVGADAGDFAGKKDHDFHMHDWYTKIDDRGGEQGEEAENEPGLSYEEWVRRVKETEERVRLERGETHEETDYGAGYLTGRYDIGDRMGWKNYSPLAPGWQHHAEEIPRHLKDRHLLHAAAQGDCEILLLLLSHGASASARNNESFLPATIRFGLEDDSGQRLNVSDAATYGGFSEQDRSAVICAYNWTAAHWAACYGHADIVELLAGNGAPLSDGDMEQMTPLHVAAGQGHTHVVKTLLFHGANASFRDSAGNTPLHFAVYEGNIDAVSALVRGGADVSQGNVEDYTPLHWAASKGHVDIIKILLAHGADAEAEAGSIEAEDYVEPMTLAAEKGHASACEVMAHHLGLEKRGLETMNSYELKKLHEKTREEVSQVQREMLLKVQPAMDQKELNSRLKELNDVLTRIGDIEQEWINERGPPPKFGYHDLEPPCDPFDSSKDVLDKDAFDTTDYDRPDNTTSSEESISGWESD